ncbi:ATP-binding protein [Segatella intestinalis]|uniref:ATP-binding protein n=1 Tax=Segatella intestinalis TaxID=3035284 RepID=UPI0023ED1D79|nr:ATP-binding protein [Prevotella sp. B2-R-102]MDF4240958.1 ATP-binding protein [Prevotella sp. B2-R-102]
MAKRKVNITNNSISNTVTKDINKAICEYLWNGFDANASQLSIKYTKNAFNITSLEILDNGEGIDRSSLQETFGCFQDSQKLHTYQWSSQVKGKKGKGRYSFNCFASKADWVTVYKDKESHYIRHKITIKKGDNQNYDDNEQETKPSSVKKTGTTVSFSDINLPSDFFDSEVFLDYLKKEFAVFLFLNKAQFKEILINGEKLDYEDVIEDSDNKVIQIEGDRTTFYFNVTYIRWKEKMKENYSMYFLDSSQTEKFERTTTFNNKDTKFHHSLYISSDYFNHFVDDATGEKNLFGTDNTSPKDKVFKTLVKKLKCFLEEKQKKYVAEVASKKLLEKYQSKGIIRQPQNDYDKILVEDLKKTISAMYEVQPKIFTNLQDDQAKTLVGVVELLLQTDKREDLISIMESVVKLSDDERHNLASVLKTTDLARITDTIRLIQNRIRTISALKVAVKPENGMNEVDDLQKLVEQSFWIFGEEYNIVTQAEPDFNQALMEYLDKLYDTVPGISKSNYSKDKIEHPDVNKEMDIFAFRQNIQSSTIDNIVVELKHPTVKLGEKELSQVKTYMNVIMRDSRFNASNMRWKFFLVGNDFDSSNYLHNEMRNAINWGKKNLVCHVDNNGIQYEIFVIKWSELFADFEIRHNFLLKKLEMKRDELSVASVHGKTEIHSIVAEANTSDTQ